MRDKTEQELFWEGDFGQEYITRNQGDILVSRNIVLFANILARTRDVNSVIEFCANIGLNLKAIRQLIPQVEISAVEINKKAIEKLQLDNYYKVYQQSIIDLLLLKNMILS